MRASDVTFYAHSAPDRSGWEPLSEHLLLVARRASTYASVFEAGDEAFLAGLIHDLGKYAPVFLKRLENQASHLDHWTPGAMVALDRYQKVGIAVALAIEGHHIGLQCAAKSHYGGLAPGQARPTEGCRFTEADPNRLLQRLTADGIELPALERSLFTPAGPRVGTMLDLRMLFSTLVDADFLETEAHFDRDAQGQRQYRPAPPELQPERALAVLDDHLAELTKKNRERSSKAVQKLRGDLLAVCRDGASHDPGLFTLSAPTGAGKTLSMLAFALRHAKLHGLRRVVLAIPFLSILEQTVQEYRKVLQSHFGPGYILEHHSLAGTRSTKPEGDEQDPDEILRRRQAENWDAPLVVTTNVQLLESLFAHRPGPCRKLHRLAQSVILFDEVQTLPLHVAVPTLAALSHLSSRYGASVVFSTATQPAFDHLDRHVGELCETGWKPKELVPSSLELFARSRRVTPEWRLDRPMSWDEVADELAREPQALCIVNLKRHALELARRLADRGVEGLFHLSTYMCPAHRSERVEEVKRRLAAGEPCRLISTQCIEAGVDVDFPVVYRAFGPLDAIAQAAGRCNRHGVGTELGRLMVFVPEDERYPTGAYQRAAKVTRLHFKELAASPDLQDPKLFRTWYRRLYDLSKIGEGATGREKELDEALRSLHFESTARRYRLIDQDGLQVVVPWDRDAYEKLKQRSRKERRLTRGWMREAQPYAVSVFRPRAGSEAAQRILPWLEPAPLDMPADRRSEDWFFVVREDIYDEDFGLVELPETLIV